MKKILLLSILFSIFLGELNAQGAGGLYRRSRTPNNNGNGFSFNDYLGYQLLDGNIPGIIDVKVLFGPSFINGDTNGKPVFPSFSSNNMISLQMNHIFPGNLGYVLSYMYGTYTGNDSTNSIRGYAYKSTISEISLQAKYYIIGGPYADDPTHSLYVYGGFGIAFLTPKSTNNKSADLGSWTIDNGVTNVPIYLPNPPAELVFPLGIGYQYALTDNISIGAEFSAHMLLGDYAEGLKPKPPVLGGNNVANDNITHFAVTLSFKLYKER